MPSYIRTRPEFAVNSFTAGDQTGPSVATFADGGFIVTWVTRDPTQDGYESAIKAQLFDSAGAKVGVEFRINSAGNGHQFTPRVATLDNGNFLVTWVTNISDDGSDGIKAQLFDRSGQPIGGEFQVNMTGSSLFEPNVTSLADGRFIISWDDWSSYTVKAQIFDAGGARLGAVLTLANDPAQGFGDIIALANGGFVATWRINGTSWDVKAQVFDASGARVGGEFVVNTTLAGSQNAPAAAALADGGFVITWSESNPEYQSGNTRIKAQVFTASGVKVGGELLVSTTAAYSMGGQVVTALPDGGFIIAWDTFVLVAGGGSDSEVRAQRFTASGAKVDGEFLINTLTAGHQSMPDLDTLADGRVIAVWASDNGDIDGKSVRAQILGTTPADPLPNTQPVIISNGGGTSASLTHDEGVTAVTTVVASDDGEPNNLRYSITGGFNADLFTINALTGALAFITPPEHVEGGDNFYTVTVTVSDGELTSFQSIQISVRHVNYITIVSDGGYDWAEISVDENQTGVTTVSAVNEDGLPLTYAITGGDHAHLFTIDAQTGALSFTTAPDYEAPEAWDNAYYVQVTASDGTRSDSQLIAVRVNDVWEPEGFSIVSDGGGDHGQIGTPENSLAVTVVAVNGAAGPVTYEIVGGYDASLFTINAETGELSFVDAPDYETAGQSGWGSHYYYYGGYQVVVRASDGVSVDEQELKVVVENVDEAPVFYSYWGEAEVALTVAENMVTVATVVAEDPDSYGGVTYGIAGGADSDRFEVDPYSGELRFKGPPDAETPRDSDGDNVYEVAVVAYSGELSATQSFSITVEDVEELVTINSNGGGDSAIVLVPENGLAVTFVAADGPGAVYYEIAGGADASFFTIDAVTGALSFIAPPDYEASGKNGDPVAQRGHIYDVIVRASDGFSFDEQRLTVWLTDVDEAPEILSYGGASSVDLTASENVSLAGAVLARDPDRSSSVTYAIAGGADAALFQVDSSGRLSFRQAPNFESPADSDGNNVYQVTVVANSGALSASQAFSITVANANERPVFASGASFEIAEGQTAVTTLSATDPEGGVVTFSIAGGADAALFAIDAATGALSFLAAPDFEAPADSDGDNVYDVQVSASDGQLSETKSLSVSVADLDPPVALGDEFTVNSTYARTQAQSDATRLADGNFVVTWIDADFNTTAGRFLRAQIFAPDGVKIGGELTLASTNVGTEPSVAALPGGGFVIAWRPLGAIAAQMFDSAGNATSSRITVSNTGSGVGEAQIAVLANGGFAITWDDSRSMGADVSGSGVHVRVYDAAGAPVGGDALVNTSTTGNQADPSIAALANGGYVVTWTDRPGQGAPWVAKAQIFDSAGARVGGEFVVSGPRAMYSTVVETSVVTLSNGNFAVAWTDGTEAGPDHRIQIYSPDGAKVGEQIVAPSKAYMLQVGPSLTALSDGGFALAWSPNSSPYYDGSDKAIYVQAYDAAGRPNGPPTRVNGQANGDQFDPSIASLGDGRFVVTWTDINGAGADDDQVMARIFAPEGYVWNQRPVIVSNGGGASASLQIDEGLTAVTTVVASDPDGPGAVTYSISGGAHAGLFAIDPATGALRFLVAPDYEAPAGGSGNVYAVTVKASDGELSSFQSLSITVADVNENVTISSNGGGDTASLSVAENVAAVTTVAASGPGSVTYSIAGGADALYFTIDASSGALAFAGPTDFEGTGDADSDNVYEVTVRASNGSTSDDQHLSITLTDVDEDPDFFNHEPGVIALWAAENRAYVGILNAYDVDGGPAIAYSVTGGADGALFAIDPVSGELFFLNGGGPDFEAPADSDGDNVYEVEVTATAGSWSRARDFTVTIVDENEPLVITSDGGGTSAALSIAEGGQYVTTVVADDPDGTAPIYSIAGGPDAARFTIDPATGVLSFVEAPDYEAPADEAADNFYTVQVAASDGQHTAWQTVQILVGNVNEGVTITTGPALSVNEDSAFVATIAATDGDGDPLSYAIVGGADASHFAIDPVTGDLTIRTSLDFEAPADADGDNVYEVTVRASDGQLSTERQMSITVNDVYDTVEITSYGGADSVALTLQENSFQVADVDASLSPFWGTRFTISGADAALFTVDPISGQLSFKYPFFPDFEAPGDADGDNVYDVVVTASTATSSDSQAFAITVADRNEGLWITSNDGGDASLSIDEGGLSVTVVTAYDMDGDVPTYSIAGGPDAALFAIDPVTGALTFIAAPDYEAPGDSDGNNVYRVTVAASDGEFTGTQNLSITVANVDEGVTITSNGGGSSASVSVAENGTAVATVAATDADGGAVTYAIAGGADAARFTIDATTGALAFVSAPNFEAPTDAGGDNVYDVLVSASDGSFTDTQAIAVTVGDVNEAVAITSNGGGATATASVAENSRSVTTVAAVDPDGTAPTYSIVGGADAARFTIDPQTGQLQFVTAPDHEAPGDADGDNVYSVVVQASDGVHGDLQTLSVGVLNLRDGNVVNGTSGGDSISGVNANPALRTTNAEDTVSGQGGHDTILGLAGDDILNGDAGNDVLNGGAGADQLTGGLGKDQFIYNAASESTAAARDVITDFSRAQSDKISLSGIDANSLLSGNQAFTFIGTAAFSNVAGQLRYATSGGVTLVSGDVNGDGLADFQIELTGTLAPIASDFVL